MCDTLTVITSAEADALEARFNEAKKMVIEVREMNAKINWVFAQLIGADFEFRNNYEEARAMALSGRIFDILFRTMRGSLRIKPKMRAAVDRTVAAINRRESLILEHGKLAADLKAKTAKVKARLVALNCRMWFIEMTTPQYRPIIGSYNEAWIRRIWTRIVEAAGGSEEEAKKVFQPPFNGIGVVAQWEWDEVVDHVPKYEMAESMIATMKSRTAARLAKK